MTESTQVKEMVESFQKEVGSGEDLSALLGEGPSEGVSEGVSEGGMAIVNTGEIVPLDTSVKDPKFSSSYLEMVYARNIAKLKAEVRQEQLDEQARRQEGALVQRQQSELARVVNRTKTLGANAELPEVNARTSRMAWFRTRLNVNGPAYLRDLWRRPMIKYKNLSEEEVARIHKTRADKTLWNRILQGTEDIVPRSQRPPTDEELKAERMYNFTHGRFDLMRTIPTVLEKKLSRHHWGRGLYLDWRNVDPFPYAQAIDSDMSPSTNLLRDKEEYEAWKERDNSNNYLLKDKTTAQSDFHAHWKKRCLEAAELAYKAILAEKEEQRKMAELERKRERQEEKRLKMKAKQLMLQSAAGLEVDDDDDDNNTHVRLQREVAALKEQINKAHHQPEEKEGEDLNNAEISKGNKTNSGDGGGGDDDNDDSDGDGEDEDEEEDDDYEWDGQGDPKKTSSLLKRANSGKSKKGKSKKSKSKKGTRERVNQKDTNREKKRGLFCCFCKRQPSKKTAPVIDFFDIGDELVPSTEEKDDDKKDVDEAEGGDEVGEIPQEDFQTKIKRLAKERRQSRRASRVVPYAVEEEPTVEEAPDNSKKKPKYSKRSASKRKLRPVTMTTTQFAETQAPPDKKFLRQQAKQRQREELAEMKKKQEEEEARMLAELQKETRLKKTLLVGKGVMRVLFCCCVKSTKKNKFADKFAIKSDAELESEKMQKWMSGKKDVLMVETMFTVRSIERESKRRYRAFFRWFGADTGIEFEQSADALRASCLNGRYKEVLDTLEDDDFNANSVNSSGDTAFYAVVNRALDGSGEMDHDDDDNEVVIGCWGHTKKKAGSCFKNKSQQGRLDLILKILTVRGGDVNFVRTTKDAFEDGHALVHEAAKWNREGMLDWLLTKNVNVNILTSRFRKTALMIAAQEGHGEMVRTLLHRGCIDTIHLVDNRGWTALHYAAAFCESQFVKMLLVCGADLGVRSEANRLPLEEAQSRGKMENVAVLMFHKDRSRMFTHRILFFDQEGTRREVQAQQEEARLAKAQESSGPLGLGGLRKLGEFQF